MAVPYTRWTQTALNWDKRRTRQLIKETNHMLDDATAANNKENTSMDAIWHSITDRVQKEHPGMKRIKAARFARTQDPVGRKYTRMVNAGYNSHQIRKALFGGGRHSTSGRNSG